MLGADVATRDFIRSLARSYLYAPGRIIYGRGFPRAEIIARRCPPFLDAFVDLRIVKRDEFTREPFHDAVRDRGWLYYRSSSLAPTPMSRTWTVAKYAREICVKVARTTERLHARLCERFYKNTSQSFASCSISWPKFPSKISIAIVAKFWSR